LNDLAEKLNKAKRRLIHSALESRDAFNASATETLGILNSIRSATRNTYSDAEVTTVRRALLDAAASDRASDFAEAEQVLYSFETLCLALGDIDACGPALDKLFEGVGIYDDYKPGAFARLAKSIAPGF